MRSWEVGGSWPARSPPVSEPPESGPHSRGGTARNGGAEVGGRAEALTSSEGEGACPTLINGKGGESP